MTHNPTSYRTPNHTPTTSPTTTPPQSPPSPPPHNPPHTPPHIPVAPNYAGVVMGTADAVATVLIIVMHAIFMRTTNDSTDIG